MSAAFCPAALRQGCRLPVLLSLVAALSTGAASPLQFSFTPESAKTGWTAVPPDLLYTSERGHGFEQPSQPLGGEPANRFEPRQFSVKLPEGNYDVTITFGDPGSPSTNTVKAESRRLMLERVTTSPGHFLTRTFTVNIRTPDIAGVDRVRLKPRETNVLHWDDKLTLEFNGTRPAVRAFWIEKPIQFDAALLKPGENVIQLKSHANSWSQGVMYDCVRLELGD